MLFDEGCGILNYGIGILSITAFEPTYYRVLRISIKINYRPEVQIEPKG